MTNLWHEVFDPNTYGEGILYCLRSDSERIQGHREQVISALTGLGVRIEDLGEHSFGITHPSNRADDYRTRMLLAELAALNEAAVYDEQLGLASCNSIPELSTTLLSLFYQTLIPRAIVDAEVLSSTIIPGIISELRYADHEHEHKILSNKDRIALKNLEARIHDANRRILNRSSTVIIN